MDKIVNRFYKMMNISVCMYILDIIVGVILIYYTELSMKVCAVILGSVILIHGLFSLIRYLYDGLANSVFAFEIVNAVGSIILGLFTIFYTFESVSLLGVLFGIWLIFYAVCKIFYLIKLMKFNDEIYPLVGFITILEIVMGVVVIINPFDSFMLATKLTGYFLIASSLLDVMYCLLFKKRAKQILKIFE